MNDILKALRDKFNYSQNSVAQYLGISRQMYIKYEKGDVEPPLKVVNNLSALYKVSCEWLVKSIVENENTQTSESDGGESEDKSKSEDGEIQDKSKAVYKIHDEPVLAVADPGVDYSIDQVYYDTVIGAFKKMVFTQQLKVFAELAGLVQKRTEKMAETELETKREDSLQKTFNLADVWARADAAKGTTQKWKWNREDLYDREICKHRGE